MNQQKTLFRSEWQYTEKNIQKQLFELSWLDINFYRTLVLGGTYVCFVISDIIFPPSRIFGSVIGLILFPIYIFFLIYSWISYGKKAKELMAKIPSGKKKIISLLDKNGYTQSIQIGQEKKKELYPWSKLTGYRMTSHFLLLLANDPKDVISPFFTGNMDREKKREIQQLLKTFGISQKSRFYMLKAAFKRTKEMRKKK